MRPSAKQSIPSEVAALAANYRCSDCNAEGKPRRGPDSADGRPMWQVAVRHVPPCLTVRRVVDSPDAGLAAAAATAEQTGLAVTYRHVPGTAIEHSDPIGR